MFPPISLYTICMRVFGNGMPRAWGSALLRPLDLRKSTRSGPHTLLSCASLLICLFPASALARQESVAHETNSPSFPETLVAKEPAPEDSGSVAGTVLDRSGATVSGANIHLMHRDGTQFHTMVSQADGEFNFVKILPGSYIVIVSAEGFALFTSGEFPLKSQQAYEVPDISLAVATANMELLVRPTDLIAAEQIRVQEKQRLIGVVPNFFTSYIYDAAPLTWKQKFSLAARGTFDPVSMLGVGFAAGIEQASNTFPGYGQGAAGYGKRFAAKFVDGRTSDFLTHAIYPTLFHQDPRYFYQGSGSVRSRFLHAVGSAFVTRSDSGHTAPNYSYLLGDMSAAALSNLYYPQTNRGRVVFTNATVGLAGRIGGNLLREFLPKRFTTNVPGDGKP